MSAEQQLLEDIEGIIKKYDWSKEVRFNWLREFGRTLVFFQNNNYALEFNKLSEEEFLKPKGIIAISRLLDSKCNMEVKITSIKKILKDRGYERDEGEKSWIRTDNTHLAYKEIATKIADFEEIQASMSKWVL
ncbi:hypothetical protein [Legionella cardiaca]|uniref:Uncharacterized protein n=1 Tax=Legionella cardiaca TaxID=1071983 RepID=A0ABY8ATZ0_9GAMM|nr:hypothetical protein [Legionella cardiaca]WED44033.1 hypothetical protein PXX05_04400 [Legionella cardiaca]